MSGWAWCCACAPAAGKYVIAYGVRPGASYIRDVDVYESNTWTSKADGPSPARGLHGSATVLPNAYVFGGLEAAVPYNLSRNDEYAQSSDVWTTKTSMPGTKVHHGSCAASGMAYAFAGYSSEVGQVFDDSTYQYDASADSWATKTSSPSPSRTRTTAIEIGGKAYLICGVSGGNILLSDNDEYDPSSNSWTAKTDCPSPARSSASGFRIGSKGYVAYGNQGGSLIRDNDEYEPDTWISKLIALSPARSHAASAHNNGAGYVTGGTSGSALMTDHSEYTPNVWLSKNPVPSPARWLSSSFESA